MQRTLYTLIMKEMLCSPLSLLLGVLLAASADDALTSVMRWKRSLIEWNGFRNFTANLAELESGSPSAGSRRARPILRLSDLSEFEFDGSVDQNHMPDGDGIMNKKELDQDGGFCFKGVCDRLIQKVHGSFSHGYLNGPAIVFYADGGFVFSSLRKSVLQGPYVEFAADRTLVEIRRIDGGRPRGFVLRKIPVLHFVVLGSYTEDSGDDIDLSAGFCLVLTMPTLGGNGPSPLWCGERQDRTFRVKEAEDGDVKFDPTDLTWPNFQVEAVDHDECEQLTIPEGIQCDTSQDQLKFLGTFLLLRRRLRKLDTSLTIFSDEAMEAKYREFVDKESRKFRDSKCLVTLKVFNRDVSSTSIKVGIVGHPGSGNSWTTEMLGLVTGLHHTDYDFDINPFSQVSSTFLWIKGHHQRPAQYYRTLKNVTRGREDVTWRMRNVLAYSGRAILVIRDPFRAIVSYWNHIVTKTRLECSKQLLQEVRSDLFNRFFINEIALWYEVAAEWVTLAESEVVVLFYEELKVDPVSHIGRALEALRLPYSKERLRCLSKVTFRVQGRKDCPEVTTDVLTDEAVLKMMHNIEMLNSVLVKAGKDPLPVSKYEAFKNK